MIPEQLHIESHISTSITDDSYLYMVAGISGPVTVVTTAPSSITRHLSLLSGLGFEEEV